jgi:hypothetical protein
MSKLYYRLNSLCVFLKQEKIIDDFDTSHFKLEINERKLAYDYNTLRLKFENDNKIFGKYKDCFILLDETLNKTFIDIYKSFIDEYEEEYEKIRNELENWEKKKSLLLLKQVMKLKIYNFYINIYDQILPL